MFSHVTVGSNDLEIAENFYNAVLAPLGLAPRPVMPDGGPKSLCWIIPGHALPRFYVYQPFDGEAASVGNGTMVAFEASESDVVDKAYAAALLHGGSCAGAPGPRPHYGDGYYGAYLRDPDGNKLHIAYRGDVR